MGAPGLLCGVGGAEYIILGPATTLVFTAGQPAYAPGFDPRSTTSVATQGPRLTGPVSTSWACVTGQQSPRYFAQPEGAALFGHGTAAARSRRGRRAGAAAVLRTAGRDAATMG